MIGYGFVLMMCCNKASNKSFSYFYDTLDECKAKVEWWVVLLNGEGYTATFDVLDIFNESTPYVAKLVDGKLTVIKDTSNE